MKVQKVIARFSTAPSSQTELRRVARSLGSELPRQRVDTLREFRSEISRTAISTDAEVPIDQMSYAAGYVDSMMDVTAEYETCVLAGEQSAELPVDVARGIQIAVELFRHMLTSPFNSDAALAAVAGSVLGDPLAATEAVELWARESQAAGLIHEPSGVQASAGVPARAMTAMGSTPHIVPGELLWGQESDAATPARPSLLRAMTESPRASTNSEVVQLHVEKDLPA